ncbi:MAG: VCBS repeat-containing protein [Myxococcales bacterium]|nr:VCBS repeat-containing protein [Myxococcales bacterium]
MCGGVLLTSLLSCGGAPGETDSGATDSGETDSGATDSGATDSGETDSGESAPCFDAPPDVPGFAICGAVDGDRAEGKPGGDVNGDGLDDILVETDGGPAYVVFGKPDAAEVRLAELVPSQGIVIEVGDASGDDLVVKPGGDVNGDGFDDIFVMAGQGGYGDSFEGFPDVFVVYGGPEIHSVHLSDIAPAEGGASTRSRTPEAG